MPINMEDSVVGRKIQTTREPVGPKNAATKGSVGDQALMDALIIVVAAWVILLMLSVSLRHHNV